jgi:aryl-alcohol dehydrogenase-like predicted oxidoreductase
MIQYVDKIVLGTVQMGLDYGINNKNGKIPLEQSEKILNKAYESGIKFLDTAQVYGEAHKVIGEFHKTNPTTKFKINTKISNNIDLNKVEFTIENYLKDMKVDNIETLMFHSFDSYNNGSKILDELISLKNKGIIKNIGVSVYKNIEIEKLLSDNSIKTIQLPFNVLDNLNLKGDLLRKLKFNNKNVQARSVFLQGLLFKELSNKNNSLKKLNLELSFLRELLLEFNCTMEQLAISYCCYQENIDEIILGVDSLDHLDRNIKAINFKMPYELFEKVNEIKIKNVDLLNPSLWS